MMSILLAYPIANIATTKIFRTFRQCWYTGKDILKKIQTLAMYKLITQIHTIASTHLHDHPIHNFIFCIFIQKENENLFRFSFSFEYFPPKISDTFYAYCISF